MPEWLLISLDHCELFRTYFSEGITWPSPDDHSILQTDTGRPIKFYKFPLNDRITDECARLSWIRVDFTSIQNRGKYHDEFDYTFRAGWFTWALADEFTKLLMGDYVPNSFAIGHIRHLRCDNQPEPTPIGDVMNYVVKHWIFFLCIWIFQFSLFLLAIASFDMDKRKAYLHWINDHTHYKEIIEPHHVTGQPIQRIYEILDEKEHPLPPEMLRIRWRLRFEFALGVVSWFIPSMFFLYFMKWLILKYGLLSGVFGVGGWVPKEYKTVDTINETYYKYRDTTNSPITPKTRSYDARGNRPYQKPTKWVPNSTMRLPPKRRIVTNPHHPDFGKY